MSAMGGVGHGSQGSIDGQLASPQSAHNDAISSEIARAELYIAADGSYVETTSAHAARELKRRYDILLGVGKGAFLRSPYAITAVDVHQSKMFRISRRIDDADVLDRQQQPPSPQEPARPNTAGSGTGRHRKSRLSMHTLLPGSLFKSPPQHRDTQHQHHQQTTSPEAPRKLRKSRSNSDLHRDRGHSQFAHAPPSERDDHSTADSHTHHPRQPVFVSVAANSTDPFADVVGLNDAPHPPGSASVSSASLLGVPGSSSALGGAPASPFGPGVVFHSPALPAGRNDDTLRPHGAGRERKGVREMASFESGRTATATARSSSSDDDDEDDDDPNASTESLIPLAPAHALLDPARPTSSLIFDVLQTYSGLPRPSRLSARSALETVKLSSTQTPTPKDDPRFVLYDDGRRMVAATLERWVAQLTSELDYDALLDFFLTYRSYVRARDLLQLLQARFAWTLDEPGSTVRRIVRVRTFLAMRYWMVTFFRVDFLRDEELRREVVDWVNGLPRDERVRAAPDALSIVRKLKKLIIECKSIYAAPSSPTTTNNNASAPPTEEGAAAVDPSDPVSLAASLSKAAHRAQAQLEATDVDLDLGPITVTAAPMHIGGFANAPSDLLPPTRTRASSHLLLSGALLGPVEQDSSETRQPGGGAQVERRTSGVSRALVNTLGKIGRWKRAFSASAGGAGRESASTPVPGARGEGREREREREVLAVRGGVEEYLRLLGGGGQDKDVAREERREEVVAPTPSPAAVAEEVLDIAPPTPSPPPKDTTPAPAPALQDDTDADAEDNALWTHRDVPRDSFASESSYGDVLPPGLATTRRLFVGSAEDGDDESEAGPALPPGLEDVAVAGTSRRAANTSTDSGSSYGQVITREGSSGADEEKDGSPTVTLSAAQTIPPPAPPPLPTVVTPAPNLPADPLTPPNPRASFVSSTGSDSSYGSGVVHRTLFPPGLVLSSPYGGTTSSFGGPPELVDDVDLSDSEAESVNGAVPAASANHPAARRLPKRRDFEFVRHSGTTTGSISSRAPSESEGATGELGYDGPIQQWQIDMINEHLSEDEGGEQGDAEFALRKLEGRIDSETQRAKMRKVDGWLQAMQRRMAEGGAADEEGGNGDGDEEDEDDAPRERDEDQARADEEEEQAERERGEDEEAAQAGRMLDVGTLDDGSMLGATTPTGEPHQPSPPPPPAPAEEVHAPSLPAAALAPLPASRRPSVSRAPALPHHQSFVLVSRSEAIAQHLAAVDRELFIAVRFEEIVVHDWEAPAQDEETSPTDWAAFMRARRALGAAASDVLAVKARFNIVVSWVASEIALTHPGQRAMLAAKFIRVAWKSYLQNNYAGVVAIMAGLQSQWAQRAMGRAWHKVGMWEMRVFDDLRAFTSREGNFRFVRDATLEASAEGKGCIPFLGLYLSQLHDLGQLPDFIDATSPAHPVTLDPETGALSPPRAPEVFSNLAPLPEGVALEPLVNVHKQRRIARVIKALVAGQHLADAVRPTDSAQNLNVDRRLMQRCVRLKALDAQGFAQALGM